MKTNSYKIDGFSDPLAEARRLAIRARARIETLIPQLKSLGLRENMSVLEVGPGTGIRCITLAHHLKRGRVLGIDISDTLLEQARAAVKKSGVRNVTFLKMDLYDLDLEKSSFDFIYLRLVVQHLPEPVDALKSLHGLLKPGGKIFVEDTDRDWMTIYPANPSWEKIYSMVKDAQEKLGGDPRSGRKLGSYLTAAGFKNVATNLVPVFGTGLVFTDWIENYAPTFFNNLSAVDRRTGLAVLENLKKANRCSPIFFNQVWFQSWGSR